MADISYAEKRSLERLFQMGSGYVLGFSNRTFEEFVFDSIGLNVYDEKYNENGGSKANRLRALWTKEPPYVVAKLLRDLIVEANAAGKDPELHLACMKIAERLAQAAPVPELDAITPNSVEKDFAVLAKSVKESIDKNEPEVGLDRLHTFTTKYLRALCQQLGLSVTKEMPLHSLMGAYVKHLRSLQMVESEMTERILRSSISTLESFNDVRNNRSFAHDNTVLNYEESLLIFNHVCAAIRFIESVERKRTSPKTKAMAEDDIPF